MDKNIAEKLYRHRKSSGLSQEELAEKIGVSRQAVSKWERGETSPDTENLIALAKLYNITLDELVFSDSHQKEQEDTDDKVDGRVEILPSGIQVVDKNGDKVDISWKGIDVNSGDAHVHINKEGLSVAKGGHIFNSKTPIDTKWYRFFKKFPFPILTVITYIIFGYFNICGGWALGWLIFLTIPLYYSLIDAVARKNAGEFAYPVLIVMIYLYLGMANSLWHPAWIIFLTIPLYYFLAEFIKKVCSKI